MTANLIGKIIDSAFTRFQKAADKEKGGLLGRIVDDLIPAGGGVDIASKPDFVAALRRLLSEEKLQLPDDATTPAHFKSEFADKAKGAITAFLAASGNPLLPIAGRAAIELIKNFRDKCGGNDVSPRATGAPLKTSPTGRAVVMYWLEKGDDGLPKLPAIKGKDKSKPGDPRYAAQRLQPAFLKWALKLKLDVTPADSPDEANLIVTGRDFRKESVDTDVMALTQIGPPHGYKLSMVFDTSETELTQDQFQAVATHELGHYLGIYHADVREEGDLMSPYVDGKILEPGSKDLAAATMRGWTPSS